MNSTQMTGSTVSAESKEALDSSLPSPSANKLSAGDPGRWNDKKGKRLVDNFLASYRKPFSVDVLAEMTGVCRAESKRLLKEAVAAGEAREIEKGIYLVKRRDTTISTCDWRYSRSAAEAVLEVIRGGNGRSSRSIAREMGYSRQYVFKYLEALASIGAIAWSGDRYIATGRGDLGRLGSGIEKGILHRLQQEAKA